MDILDFARGLQTSPDQREQQVYIMYHGTTLQKALKIKRDGFIPSPDGMLGRGVYVSRSFQKASAYPITLPMGEEKVVLMLKVRVGRVKKIDCQGHPQQKIWHQAGYDTAWVPPNCGMVPSGLEEDCVWDPDRIAVMEILNMDGSVKDDTASTTVTSNQHLLHVRPHQTLSRASNSSASLQRQVALMQEYNKAAVNAALMSSLFSPSDTMFSPFNSQRDISTYIALQILKQHKK